MFSKLFESKPDHDVIFNLCTERYLLRHQGNGQYISKYPPPPPYRGREMNYENVEEKRGGKRKIRKGRKE
jgi:hypothetical protein